jgi:hypothetical protein
VVLVSATSAVLFGDLNMLRCFASTGKIYDVFAWDDPMPSVANLLHYARSASRKLA